MTVDKDLKKLVRERAARTGQSYAAARHSLVGDASREASPLVDLWFTRASQGYKGKGAKPTGFEHHEIALTDQGLRVRSEVVFTNYGVHAYEVVSDTATLRTRYEYDGGRFVVEGSLERDVWRALVAADGETTALGLDLPPGEPVPSIAARFLPLARGDEDVTYVPVPEDAFPAWRPASGGSWFPVMGVAREPRIEPRVVTRVGVELVTHRRRAASAVRYDHVDAAGVVRATTWLGESGDVVAYEHAGCVLRAVNEQDARALDPRTTPAE